jgi:hypothetical protein
MNNGEAMNKIIRIGCVPDYTETFRDVFCRIKYDGSRLSISGVVGPKRNGDAHGGCGQINMSMDVATVAPAPGWTSEIIEEFFQVWNRWHLNNMRAGCQHQRLIDVSVKRTIYHYKLTTKALRERNTLKDQCMDLLLTQGTVSINDEQRALLNLSYSFTSPDPEVPDRYKLDREESKSIGWLKPSEHPDGVLMRPCAVCGYKYGSEWLKEEVPAAVIDWLRALPDTDREPAWV